MELILVLAVMIQYASGVVFAKVVRRWASWGSPDYPTAELLAGGLQVLSTALYLVVAIRGWAYWILPAVAAGMLISIPTLWWRFLFFAMRCLLRIGGRQKFKLSSWKPGEPCEVHSQRKDPWCRATVVSYDEAKNPNRPGPLEVVFEDGIKYYVANPELIRARP